MARFYAKSQTQTFGPMDASQLKSLAEHGDILPTDLVWKEGGSKKFKAQDIKGLFSQGKTLSPVQQNVSARVETLGSNPEHLDSPGLTSDEPLLGHPKTLINGSGNLNKPDATSGPPLTSSPNKALLVAGIAGGALSILAIVFLAGVWIAGGFTGNGDQNARDGETAAKEKTPEEIVEEKFKEVVKAKVANPDAVQFSQLTVIAVPELPNIKPIKSDAPGYLVRSVVHGTNAYGGTVAMKFYGFFDASYQPIYVDDAESLMGRLGGLFAPADDPERFLEWMNQYQ